jgi:hypothetical protein
MKEQNKKKSSIRIDKTEMGASITKPFLNVTYVLQYANA